MSGFGEHTPLYKLYNVIGMAIHFEWYETPVAPHQPEEKTLHARISFNGKTDTAQLRKKIQERCTLTETDVVAVLDALSRVMGEELADGRQVHLDGIGYFHPTLTCTEIIKEDTKQKNAKVRLKSIKFRADKKLNSSIGEVKVQHVKHNEHSSRLSPEEIDRYLTDYFSTHRFMTRADFQKGCGLLRNTATNHLRRLVAEGKIKNIGLRMQPIYVPLPGYYGVDAENVIDQ